MVVGGRTPNKILFARASGTLWQLDYFPQVRPIPPSPDHLHCHMLHHSVPCPASTVRTTVDALLTRGALRAQYGSRGAKLSYQQCCYLLAASAETAGCCSRLLSAQLTGNNGQPMMHSKEPRAPASRQRPRAVHLQGWAPLNTRSLAKAAREGQQVQALCPPPQIPSSQ